MKNRWTMNDDACLCLIVMKNRTEFHNTLKLLKMMMTN